MSDATDTPSRQAGTQAAIQPPDFFQNQRIELLADDRPHRVQVRVLERLPDSLLVLVPGELAAGDAPERVEIAFGHKGYYCYAPVKVQAFFSLAWFLEPPDLAASRKVQRRKFVRIALQAEVVALEASAYGQPTSSPFDMTLENVSASGCLAVVSRESVADYLMIFLNVLTLSGEPVFGRVMHRRHLSGGRLALGIAFDSLSELMQDELAQRINKEIQRNLQIGCDITV